MPKISQAFGSAKVILPSFDDSEITLKTCLSVGDTVEADKIEGNMERVVFLASRMITEWNFDDGEGNILPITVDNLKLLPVADLEFLLEAITPHIQKKTLSEKTK